MLGNVLVVCNEPAVARDLCELVSELGWNAGAVPDVNSALRKLATAVPYAIVVHQANDDALQVFQVAEQIRVCRWTPIVVALASKAANEDVTRATELDIDVVNSTNPDWAAELTRVLDRHRLRPSTIVAKARSVGDELKKRAQ